MHAETGECYAGLLSSCPLSATTKDGKASFSSRDESHFPISSHAVDTLEPADIQPEAMAGSPARGRLLMLILKRRR